MAQAPKAYDFSGLFDISPDVYPGYLQLPAAPEQTPMPYSPEGWQQTKLIPQTEGEAAPAQAKVEDKKKPAPTGFTPEQALALQKLTGVGASTDTPRGAAGAHTAPRSQVGPMQQLAAGGQATAPRASLGQILYNGRKF